MQRSSEKPRRGNLRLAMIIGAIALLWYALAMLVVLRP